MVVFNVCWLIPGLLVEIFMCWPVAHVWNPLVEGRCVWYSTFWIVLMVFEVVIDVILFVLPIQEVMKMQLSLAKKTMLVFVFAIGGWYVAFQANKTPFVTVVQLYRYWHSTYGTILSRDWRSEQ